MQDKKETTQADLDNRANQLNPDNSEMKKAGVAATLKAR